MQLISYLGWYTETLCLQSSDLSNSFSNWQVKNRGYKHPLTKNRKSKSPLAEHKVECRQQKMNSWIAWREKESQSRAILRADSRGIARKSTSISPELPSMEIISCMRSGKSQSSEDWVNQSFSQISKPLQYSPAVVSCMVAFKLSLFPSPEPKAYPQRLYLQEDI